VPLREATLPLRWDVTMMPTAITVLRGTAAQARKTRIVGASSCRSQRLPTGSRGGSGSLH